MESLARLYADLKRRGVYRVAGIYAVVAWAISEVAISLEEPLQLPGWLDTSIIVVLFLGFPIALVLSYAFDITPAGIRPDRGAGQDDVASAATGTSTIVLSIALAAAGFAAWQYFGPADSPVIDAASSVEAGMITDVSQPVPGYDGRDAIAVLPFVNLSGDPDQGYLADGISEDIITALYALQVFPVIARTSTFRYKGEDRDMREIAAELGAGYILKGSVRRIGERIRVTAQLIDAAGEHLWAENYDRPWLEFLLVQDEITYSIVEAIEPELILSETERRREVSSEEMLAWDYYLQARALSSAEFSYTTLSGVPVTRETNEEAWRLANKALEIAPNFAAIYSLLSHIDGTSVIWLSGDKTPEEVAQLIQRGLQNAVYARKLDPFEATACACQIVFLLLMQDVDGAVEVGESALLENPGSAFILAGLAKALQIAGDYERALVLIEKAKRLSPRGISMSTYLAFEARIRQSMGDWEGARRAALQSRLFNLARTDVTIIRMTSYLAEGNRNQALRVMAELRRQNPDYDPLMGGWPEPFPQAVMKNLDEPVRSRLQGSNYAQGVAIILEDLGWKNQG